MAKLQAIVSKASGEERIIDFYADEYYKFQDIMFNMASKHKDAPVMVTITRKDVLKRYLENTKENV